MSSPDLPEPTPLDRVLARIDQSADGLVDESVIPTRFASLDRAIGGGFRRGDLVVLGGDHGAGTSSLSLGIAMRCAPRALVVTGELHEERVYERALAITARVPLESFRLGVLSEEELARVRMAAPGVREWGPHVDTVTHGGVEVLWTAHDRVPDAPMIVVDGAEMLLARDFDTADALAGILLELKRFALERNVIVLLVMHLATLDRTRHDRRPRLADFGAGGAVGVHADLVLGLFREEMYDADVAVTGAAELSLLKYREGPLGYVDLYFSAPLLRFEDVLDPGI